MAYLFWPHKQECETSVPGPKRINRLNKRPAMSEHLALYAGLFLHCPLPNFTGQTVRTSELTGNKALLVRIFFDARFAGSIIAMSVEISGFLQACSTSIVATLLAIPSRHYSGSSIEPKQSHFAVIAGSASIASAISSITRRRSICRRS